MRSRPGYPAEALERQPASLSQKRRINSLRTIDNRMAEESSELWIGMHVEPASASVPVEPDYAQLLIFQQRLEQLATRAQRFTPRVSLVAPDGVLLEVQGSVHLFQGVEKLFRAVIEECRVAGVKASLALAPTPLAAMVAARSAEPGGSAHEPFIVTLRSELVGRLAVFPLQLLRWPQDVLDRLASMGVRTIGQALRLPRAGFARRFGVEQLATLDRLTGRNVELWANFTARERFRRRRELIYELHSSGTILAALAPLLADLGKFLRVRQCGVMQLECVLWHRHAPPSRCVLRLSDPLADVDRLSELLAERLNAVVLPEPVRSCELRSGPVTLRAYPSRSLWQPGEHGGDNGAESYELIERLRARLGASAVYGLQVLRDHRPEKAWGVVEPGNRSSALVQPSPGSASRSPLWLLPAPKLLQDRGGLPWRHGPLRLAEDMERIESGWWDGAGIGRDYYAACDIHGVRLWIFREHGKPQRWFLHGVFG
jgi:protein ImuB